MEYEIKYKSSSAKELRKLPRDSRDRILRTILALAENPLPAGAVKVEGIENGYRIRAGDYRIVYNLQAKELVVLIIKVGHRREIYKRLKQRDFKRR